MGWITVQATEPKYGMNLGRIDIKIHDKKDCIRDCPFHNPSNHKMKDWEMLVRFDKNSLVERLCEHGVGHPDPDSVAFLGDIFRIHGCDGCCSIMEEQ